MKKSDILYCKKKIPRLHIPEDNTSMCLYNILEITKEFLRQSNKNTKNSRRKKRTNPTKTKKKPSKINKKAKRRKNKYNYSSNRNNFHDFGKKINQFEENYHPQDGSGIF